MRGLAIACVVAAAGLVGCARYEARPLPASADLRDGPGRITVDAASLPLHALRSHRLDAGDGLDIDEVAMLAVANNPDLRAARAAAGVSVAQAFAVGLLPDPQLALSRDRQMGNAPDASIAFSAGLTLDVGALVARPTARRAAGNEVRKTDLELLWQELQVIAQARTLFAKQVAQDRTFATLDYGRALFQDRYDRTRQAAQRGLLANDSVTPHLTALQDVTRQLNDLERQRNQTRHDLDALLGIAPDVALTLVGAPDVAAIDPAQAAAALRELPARRPDLLALQAGYDAQDDRIRGALLAQFPAVTFGPNRARDTAFVNTAGVSLGLTLPLFNRNRGNIAIEQATRDKLRADYQARFDASVIEIDRLLTEQRIVARQLVEIEQALAALQDVADRATAAYTARNIDVLVMTNAQTALLAKQVERITLQEALQDQHTALQTLLASDLAPDRLTAMDDSR